MCTATKDPGDHAVDRIKIHFPPDGAERDGRNPRQKNQKTDQAAAAEGFFQGMARMLADDHHDLGANGEDEELRMATRKLGLCRTLRKFSSPTKCISAFADARVTEGIEMASRKGPPTSSKM